MLQTSLSVVLRELFYMPHASRGALIISSKFCAEHCGWQGHVCGGGRDDGDESDEEDEGGGDGCRNCGERHCSPGEVASLHRNLETLKPNP